MGREQLIDRWILGQFLQHQIHSDARPLDHGLSCQNPWVCDNVFLITSLIFFHILIIILDFGHSPLNQIAGKWQTDAGLIARVWEVG